MDNNLPKICNDNYNRYNFVKNLEKIVQSCSNLEKPSAFFLEGSWGIGKTWVLKKLEQLLKGYDLSENVTEDELKNNQGNYFVFKYNAWENDYYDEPLIGMLISITNQLNEMLASKQVASKIVENIAKALSFLLSIVSQKLLGIDIVSIGKRSYSALKKLKKDAGIKLSIDNQQNIEHDLTNIVEILNTLSETKPIVFLVDELDRCIPQNAIKTLERLHHLFGRINRSVTIISIQREQLEESIRLMFCNEIPGETYSTKNEFSCETYLAKFVDFSISLNNDKYLVDITNVNKSITELSKMFSKEDNKTYSEIIENISSILSARDFEKIYNSALICHNLLGLNTNKFPYFCCIAELILSTYKFACKKENNPNVIFSKAINEPKSDIGKYLRKLWEKAINVYDGDMETKYVMYVVSIVSGHNKTTVTLGNYINDSPLLTELKEHYQKYKEIYDFIK